MFSKICSAAQALWKILLEICQNCRYFMVCLGKCCGERFKYVCWILKEMVKVPGGFLSNDGIAPISILIVHKFKLKVSVCTARTRWGCGSSPVCWGLVIIAGSWATASGWMTAPWPTWATSSPSQYGWPSPAGNYIICLFSDIKLSR